MSSTRRPRSRPRAPRSDTRRSRRPGPPARPASSDPPGPRRPPRLPAGPASSRSTPSGRRLGAGDRRRPERAVGLRARHPLRRPSRAPATARRRGWRSRSARTAARRGATGKPLCACKGSGQFDPIIEVVPNNGAVYALYMNGFNVMFTKSTDHGATWSAPVKTYGNVSLERQADHRGERQRRRRLHLVQRPDRRRPVDGPVARLRRDLDADEARRLATATTSTSTPTSPRTGRSTSPSRASSTAAAATRARPRPARSRSTSSSRATAARRGRTGRSAPSSPGSSASPPAARRTTTSATSPCPRTATGNARRPLRRRDRRRRPPDRSTAKRSTNGGATWSAPVTLSAAGENVDAPAVESRGSGDVRAWYYQTSGGGNVDAWNVWYRTVDRRRRDVDAPVKISDATGGAAYKTAGRLRRGLRRLRRDRDHEHRQVDRGLGRGRELRRPGRRLDQPPELVAGPSRRAPRR